MTALERLARNTATINRHMNQRGPLIAAARDEGATWEQIASAAGMSRAGVINLHNATRDAQNGVSSE